MSPQKKISLFLFLTLALSMFSYVPIILAGTLSVNGGMYVLTMMWSPGLAAILTQLISDRTLRGLGWRFGSPRWLGIAYILPIAYALPVYMFTWLAGLGFSPFCSLITAQDMPIQPWPLHYVRPIIHWSPQVHCSRFFVGSSSGWPSTRSVRSSSL